MSESVSVLFEKASALRNAREFAAARTDFERVIALKPDHAAALASLSDLAFKRRDLLAARDFAARALAADQGNLAAILALAAVELESGDCESALSHLEPLARAAGIGPENRATAQSLIGDALDRLNRHAEAFAAYASSKALVRSLYRAIYEAPGRETAAACIPRLIDAFRSIPAETWRSSGGDARAPVFLVGFPRSGTTLLQQILASHPEVESAEEYDFLIESARKYVYARDGFAALVRAGDAELDPYRADYRARAAEAGVAGGRKIFIDKLPFNSIVLPLIARLFPGAKLIVAIRDPRDVVLSCFRRRFGMNVHMYELLSLESAASYYNAVMTLVANYLSRLDLAVCTVRHEDLVSRTEPETKRLCTFLGIEWVDAILDFAARAQMRELRTPSASQVARGLNAEGVGQWRKYRQQMAPVLPVLAPWVERFGYAAQ